jgi:hypothetical protein
LESPPRCEAADGVIHPVFNHDFDFAGQLDRRAIDDR